MQRESQNDSKLFLSFVGLLSSEEHRSYPGELKAFRDFCVVGAVALTAALIMTIVQ